MTKKIEEIKRNIELYRALRNEAENKFSNEWERICRKWMSSGLPYDEAKKFADGGTKHLSNTAAEYGKYLEKVRNELQIRQQELEEIHNPDIKYQRLLKQKALANTESDLHHIAILFRGMNGYRDSNQLADECIKKAKSISEEQKRIAEQKRLEQLRIAEKERLERLERERIIEKERLERERIKEEERIKRERIAEKERIEKTFWDEFHDLESTRRKYEDSKFWKEQRDLWKEQGLCVVCGGKLSIFRRKCYHKRHRYYYLHFEQIPLAELNEHLNEISGQRDKLFHKLDNSPFSELIKSMWIETELSRIGEEAERQADLLAYKRLSLKKYRKKKRRTKIRTGVFILIALCILGLFYGRFGISQNVEPYIDKKEYV